MLMVSPLALFLGQFRKIKQKKFVQLFTSYGEIRILFHLHLVQGRETNVHKSFWA